MSLLAVTALEKAAAVPPRIWIDLGLGILAFFAAVWLLRRAAGVNKLWLAVAAFVMIAVVGFHWIYSRSEPRFLTPLVDKIAPFFPSAGAYTARQDKTPQP